MTAPPWDDTWGPFPAGTVVAWKKRAKFLLACGWAVAAQVGREDRGVPVLTYHGTPAERSHTWWHDFRGQMSLIEDLGYEVVPLGAVVEAVSGRRRPDRPEIALTFDDAWRNNLDVAVPELARRGWPATVFAAGSFIGRRPFMTAEELRDIARMGFEIGNHTQTHPDIAGLDPATIREELRSCSDRITEATGRPPKFFCYPYGHVSPSARDEVAAFGFEGACTGLYGFNAPGTDPFLLRRLLQEPGEGTRELRIRLAGGYNFIAWRQRATT